MQNIRYNIQDLPQDASEIRLIYCAIARYNTSWHSILHRHPHAELFFCLDGKGELQIASERVPLEKGDFFLINPGVEHTERSTESDPLSYIVIGASGVRFLSDGTSSKLPLYRIIKSRNSAREFEPYFQDILREVSREREGYLDICLSILNILFAKISRSMQIEMANSLPLSGALNCSEIKQIIDEQYSKPITLEWLAEQAHISKYHLSHSFQKQYSISPIQYLNQRRLQEAEHLLAHTTHSLNDIGNLIGFSSPSYFSQAFKRNMGVSPSEYRRTHKKSLPSSR